MNSATGGPDPLRWVRRGCDGAVRIAIVAAALCPALASLGGSVVAALLVAIRWCGEVRGRAVEEPPSAR